VPSPSQMRRAHRGRLCRRGRRKHLLKLIQALTTTSRSRDGIIYIDEIDKIARKSENPSITRDVSAKRPAALLKILEALPLGTPQVAASTPPGVHPDRHDNSCLFARGVRRFGPVCRPPGKQASLPAESAGPRTPRDDSCRMCCPRTCSSSGSSRSSSPLPILGRLDARQAALIRI